MNTSLPQVVAIVGPTACGKTRLSIALAQAWNGEVVSVDSVAVYKGLQIGSARPGFDAQQGVVHHLLDCVDCADAGFSVSVFQSMTISAIDDILSRGKLPVLTGGSGLYLDSLLSPMTYAVTSDDKVRRQLANAYDDDPEAVFDELQRRDPSAAARLHPNDKNRVVRALEVMTLCGTPISELNAVYADRQRAEERYSCLRIGLIRPREQLYAAIDERVDEMIGDGLVEEAYALYERGLDRSLPAMKAIGYAQLMVYFDGQCTLLESIQKIKSDTRHYAKRQMTWFRRDPRIHWYHVEDYPSFDALVGDVLKSEGVRK